MSSTFILGDPMQHLIDGAFERLFDPSLRATEINRDEFLEKRYKTTESLEIDRLLLLEATDAGLLHFDGINVRTMWSKEQAVFPRQIFPREMLRAIGLVNIRTRRMHDEIMETVKIRGGETSAIRAVQAIEEIAFRAYSHSKPRKDNSPYYLHAFDSAAVSHSVMYGLHTDLSIEKNKRPKIAEIVAVDAAGLGHDIVEEYPKPERYYSMHEEVDVYTPYLIQMVLRSCGLQGSDAILIANAIRLMTHEKEEKGWMSNYPEYVGRLASNRAAALAKIGEGHNNFAMNEKPMPEEANFANLEEFKDSLAKYHLKRRQQGDLVFGNLLTDAPNPKNVFRYKGSERFQVYGMAAVRGIRGTIVTPEIAESYPEVDFSGAVSPEEYKATKRPDVRRQFINTFNLPDRYPDLIAT